MFEIFVVVAVLLVGGGLWWLFSRNDCKTYSADKEPATSSKPPQIETPIEVTVSEPRKPRKPRKPKEDKPVAKKKRSTAKKKASGTRAKKPKKVKEDG